MNQRFKISLVMVVFSVLASCSSTSLNSNFELRPYKQIQLENGLTVLLLKDQSLPYFSASLLIKTGFANDPVAYPGLTQLVASLLDKGTQKHSAMELANEFGTIGSTFSASVSEDFTVLGAGTLAQHQETLMGLIGEVVSMQRFSNSEISRQKRQFLAAISRSADDPSRFASQLYSKYLYGSHPYGGIALGTRRGINSIKKKQIIRHYMKHFRPNNSILAVVGNYQDNIQEVITGAFSKWKPRDQTPTEFQKIPRINGTQIRLVDKSDLTQAQIRLGHIGIKRSDPDFLKLRVANTILGRGFTSRLMDKVRDNLGLTYHIGSSFDASSDYGPFTISTFTQNSKVQQTLEETIKILKDFHSNGVTDDEVRDAKNYLLGVFPQAISTPEKLAFNLLVLRYYGIPDTYLTGYQDEISKLSASDVNKAIKKHLHPDDIKVLVYAKSSAVLEQLRPVGIVEKRKFSEFK